LIKNPVAPDPLTFLACGLLGWHWVRVDPAHLAIVPAPTILEFPAVVETPKSVSWHYI
jgi:hypothetical protein